VLAFFIALRYQAEMNKDSIEQLAAKLAEAVPQGLRSVREDLEANFRSVLRGGLARLDLVTREEFEVQQAVLARTREKLDVLEAHLARLDKAAMKPSVGKRKKPAKKKKVASKKTGKKD
jgi:BMFP domain-containing protein YqiC